MMLILYTDLVHDLNSHHPRAPHTPRQDNPIANLPWSAHLDNTSSISATLLPFSSPIELHAQQNSTSTTSPYHGYDDFESEHHRGEDALQYSHSSKSHSLTDLMDRRFTLNDGGPRHQVDHRVNGEGGRSDAKRHAKSKMDSPLKMHDRLAAAAEETVHIAPKEPHHIGVDTIEGTPRNFYVSNPLRDTEYDRTRGRNRERVREKQRERPKETNRDSVEGTYHLISKLQEQHTKVRQESMPECYYMYTSTLLRARAEPDLSRDITHEYTHTFTSDA